VTIDRPLPAERLSFLLADCGAPLLVADAGSLDKLSGVERTEAAIAPVTADAGGAGRARGSAASVTERRQPGAGLRELHLDGSTGRPNGCRRHPWQRAAPVRGDRVLVRFPAPATPGRSSILLLRLLGLEIWGALLYGGRLVVVPQAANQGSRLLLDLLADERVTCSTRTPSAFRSLIAAATLAGAPTLRALRQVIFGGEALDPRRPRAMARPLWRWQRRRHGRPRSGARQHVRHHETTVHVTWHRVLRREIEVGVGEPHRGADPDLSVQVLDPYGRPAPIGVGGELSVGGAAVGHA